MGCIIEMSKGYLYKYCKKPVQINDPLQKYNTHKDNFYQSYTSMYNQVWATTHLITNEKYDYIVLVLTI